MHRRTVNICATVLSLVTLHSAVRISTKPHDHADKTLSVEVKMNSEKVQQTMYSGLSAPGATRKIKLVTSQKGGGVIKSILNGQETHYLNTEVQNHGLRRETPQGQLKKFTMVR